eukprot:CAMPEP_0197877846 /NCGR_PEP_ID=MMETSP1439-20131203/6412_1 /TAXON_ID=66791 /ORGANISM="Gonyaulax spinifera, Strain CCMP409" /LENGTH=423 /DNA_ID=CAMNT_0043497223 /DNA_START=60 /DNA_END=1331 /DNA_ORIENTATION=+
MVANARSIVGLAMLIVHAFALSGRHQSATSSSTLAGPASSQENPICQFPKPWGDFRFCKMNDTTRCPLSAMKADAGTLVQPAGNERCLSDRNQKYMFQVMPGSRDKLLLYFDGGGACWNQLTVGINACDKQEIREPFALHGILRQQEANPFRDYTIIYVMYCSGDLASGDVVQPFLKDGKPVEQRGHRNTMSVLEWAKENMAPTLEALTISGQSAGSIATQVWSTKLLREFSWKSASILADSYVGAFPDGFQGPVFKSLGVCDVDLLDPPMKEKCKQGDITITDNMEYAMKTFPNVSFGIVSSMFDVEQLAFYQKASVSMGLSHIGQLFHFNTEQVNSKVGGILTRLSQYPNFFAYIKSSNAHVFTACDRLYDTTLRTGGTDVKLTDWIEQLISPAGPRPKTLCEEGNYGGSFCHQSGPETLF